MGSILVWAVLWLWCAFGTHAALFLVDWRNTYFLRSLPRPDRPDAINANRVIASLILAVIAFVAWPVFFWLRLRSPQRENQHDDEPSHDQRSL